MSGPGGGNKQTAGLRILVVDDESGQREILAEILRDQGYEVDAFARAEDGLEKIRAHGADLVLTDLRMPGMDGLALLAEIRRAHPEVAVLLMTAYGTVSSAVEAMKKGAFDYLQKPFERDELVQRVRRVAERNSLVRENRRLRRELEARARPEILGRSSVTVALLRKVERIAHLAGDVLVAGESGTGKELVARALHYGSDRAGGPFVPVNCAAIPEGLAESELFGHEKGAFTHASQARAGRFEQADGGTLFLDEISAMPLALQAKLLRVLQDRVVERVGGDRPRTVDVRIVAATNLELTDRIREGGFRADLYHRLNVHEVWIPPLRERGEDVVLLAQTFRDRAAARFDMPAPELEPALLEFFRTYPFPGNVRELEHMMEKMVALSDGEPLGTGDLPPSVRRGRLQGPGSPGLASEGAASTDPFETPAGRGEIERGASGLGSVGAPGGGTGGGTGAGGETAAELRRELGAPARPEDLIGSEPVSLFEIEERLLQEAIRRSGGNLSEAARRLSISYKTMRYRARKFGLDE